MDFETEGNRERRFPGAGDALWVNPGEILGWKGPSAVHLWDTEENADRFVEV